MTGNSPFRLLLRVVVAELRQHLRDPLTLVFMVLVPLLLYPALGMAGHRAVKIAMNKADAQVLNVAIDGEIRLPANLNRIEAEDIREAVESGSAVAGARLTPSGAELWWDSRSPDSIDARARIGKALTKHRKATQPTRVDSDDTLSRAARDRETAARILPALLLFTLLAGGLYTALDVITGEKERGTMETLLTTAAERWVVLGGKFAVVLCFTLVTTLFSVVSAWVAAGATMGLDLPLSTAALTFVLFLPMAVLMSAILSVAAAWAPDFKSGQVLTTPLLILPLAMAAVTFLPGFALTYASALLPIAGLALATREVLAGHALGAPVAVAFVATSVWAGLTLAWGVRLMGREDVVLGTRGGGQRRMRGDYRADAASLWGIALLALWFLGQTAQSIQVWGGMAFTQLALLAPLALVAPWWLGLPIRSTLRLVGAPAREWLRALVVGLCLPGLALSVASLQGLILTTPTSLFEGVFPENAPLWQLTLVFAVLPGVCEELLFRGAFFGLWRTRASPAATVAVTALAFGLFHLSIFRFLPTAVLGCALGVLSLRNRSVLPGMLAHALNNGFAMVALSQGWAVEAGWASAAAAVVVLAALAA